MLPTLSVPGGFTDDGRAAYLAIARRAQVEAVNGYTVLSLGLQSYLSSREIAARGL